MVETCWHLEGGYSEAFGSQEVLKRNKPNLQTKPDIQEVKGELSENILLCDSNMITQGQDGEKKRSTWKHFEQSSIWRHIIRGSPTTGYQTVNRHKESLGDSCCRPSQFTKQEGRIRDEYLPSQCHRSSRRTCTQAGWDQMVVPESLKGSYHNKTLEVKLKHAQTK